MRQIDVHKPADNEAILAPILISVLAWLDPSSSELLELRR